MMALRRMIPVDDRTRAAVTVVIAVGVLAYVYGVQFIDGLAPCPLCWWQRYAWIAALALALTGWVVPLARRGLLAGAALALLIGAGIAVYHVGIENGWWQGGAGCGTFEVDPNATVEQLRAALMERGIVPCTEVVWSLFGWSMAAWNAVVSFLLSSWIGAGILRRGS